MRSHITEVETYEHRLDVTVSTIYHNLRCHENQDKTTGLRTQKGMELGWLGRVNHLWGMQYRGDRQWNEVGQRVTSNPFSKQSSLLIDSSGWCTFFVPTPRTHIDCANVYQYLEVSCQYGKILPKGGEILIIWSFSWRGDITLVIPIFRAHLDCLNRCQYLGRSRWHGNILPGQQDLDQMFFLMIDYHLSVFENQ